MTGGSEVDSGGCHPQLINVRLQVAGLGWYLGTRGLSICSFWMNTTENRVDHLAVHQVQMSHLRSYFDVDMETLTIIWKTKS